MGKLLSVLMITAVSMTVVDGDNVWWRKYKLEAVNGKDPLFQLVCCKGKKDDNKEEYTLDCVHFLDPKKESCEGGDWELAGDNAADKKACGELMKEGEEGKTKNTKDDEKVHCVGSQGTLAITDPTGDEAKFEEVPNP